MGRRDRERSRSRSRDRRKDKSHRSHRDRSRSRDRKRKKSRSRSTSKQRIIDKYSTYREDRGPRERKSKFDTNAAGEHVDRRSKWGDQPVKAIAPNPSKMQIPTFDANQISINDSNIDDGAIQINANGSNPNSSLQRYQAEMFDTILSGAKFDDSNTRMDVRIQDVRPNHQPVIEDPQGFSIHHGGASDTTKLKRKIFVPKDGTFNYTGLIIGPKGTNQKRLEEISGCKILVRGRGSQKEGQGPQPDEDEDQHVLIIGDNEMQLAKATAEIEKILFADEETRIKIRQEQLRMVAQLKNDPNYQPGKQPTDPHDLSLTTPYGPPSPNAFVVAVPNDCVGLVIGKSGETIKLLQANSGARRVQVAAASAPGSGVRNVFVEGERESYERVKSMVEEIIEQQKRNREAQAQAQAERQREEVVVPNNLVGLVIGNSFMLYQLRTLTTGKGGESVKNIMAETGASIFIPKECEPGTDNRVLIVSGKQDQINHAKELIFAIVDQVKP